MAVDEVPRYRVILPTEDPSLDDEDEGDLPDLPPPVGADVVRPMTRRPLTQSIDRLDVVLPRARRIVFKATLLQTLGRLLFWAWAFIRFYAGNLGDTLRRRSSVDRRARRLRMVFENAGPTFGKLAQQLSMRADMLPYAYCAELSKMLDRAPTFPTEQAIEIIERNLGRTLSEVFSAFDPQAIGSASLACVYQAQLRTGERVAVKVRRPGIGPLIAADLRAVDWLLAFGETITLIAPGATRAFRKEFETILFSELNFRAEARSTDLFRTQAIKKKKDVTAPKVYFDYSTEEIMVTELVSGVWMWELMQAVDSNDQAFLAKVAEIGIEPTSLARKMVAIMQQEMQEELFFHADPHPANLVIMPNNMVCFLDFGAIGRFSTKTRKLVREFQYHMTKGDIGRMTSCAIALMGPLPPMDVDAVHHELEAVYAEGVYAMRSSDAEWWERSAAQGWVAFMEVARKYNIPAGPDTIQFFRTTFSYDAVITRLAKDLDITVEWQAYAKRAARQARLRVKARMKERGRGITDMDYARMEEVGDAISQAFFQFQRNVENPIFNFRNIVGKIAYVVSLLLNLVFLAGAVIVIGLIVQVVARRWFEQEVDWWDWLGSLLSRGWVQLALVVVALVVIRRIVIRLNQPDTKLRRDRG